MTITMGFDHRSEDLQKVLKEVERAGLGSNISRGRLTVVGIIGDESLIDFDKLRAMQGVTEARPIESPFKQMSREFIHEDVIVHLGYGVLLGEGKPIVYMAGPCAIENYDQLARIAEQVIEAGAQVIRGGAFKPRSSAHSHQGIGEEGLVALHKVGQLLKVPTITEVRSETHVDIVAQYADILQIGMRNGRNQDLIEAAAKTGKPILLKRPDSAQPQEWFGFAERVILQGNMNLILCERGILPPGGPSPAKPRNVLDLGAVGYAKKETPFPVVVDPSHSMGITWLVGPASMAAIAMGAHGILIDVHDRPPEAICDGAQAISPAEFKEIKRKGDAIAEIIRS